MMLLTKVLKRKLQRNGELARKAMEDGGDAFDFLPVVKLFTPDGGATWLLTEIDPDDEDRAFGLCDLGLGMPELGYVSLKELSEVRGKLGLPIERDLYFEADKPLSKYLDEALAKGVIVA